MTARDAIAPLITLAAYVLLHWKGMALDPDSWAAWQAAISLLAGKGYTYFSGNPIHSWPPLYAIYLVPWIAVLGPAVWTLMISNASLVLVQSLLWVVFARAVARDSRLVVTPRQSIALSVFVGLFVAVNEQSVFAHNLVYTLLPLFLLSVWRLVAPQPRALTLSKAVGPIALATCLLLTHTSAVAFVGAAAAVLVLFRWQARAWLLAVLLVVVPLAVWGVVHVALDQAGSQLIGWGQGRYGTLVYARQLLEGPGSLLAPAKFGAPFVAIGLLWLAGLALIGDAKASGLRFGLAVVAISQAVLFCLFNLSWVIPSMVGRFVLFVPLILVPLVGLTASAQWPRVATLVFVMATLSSIYWTASWGVRQLTNDLAGLGYPSDFMPPSAYIERDHRSGPDQQTERGLLVKPYATDEIKGYRR
jgi:hypothetical protein